MYRVPRDSGFVEEACEVHHAVLLGQDRGMPESDHAAEIDSVMERRQRPVPPLRAVTSLLDGHLGPGNSCALGCLSHTAQPIPHRRGCSGTSAIVWLPRWLLCFRLARRVDERSAPPWRSPAARRLRSRSAGQPSDRRTRDFAAFPPWRDAPGWPRAESWNAATAGACIRLRGRASPHAAHHNFSDCTGCSDGRPRRASAFPESARQDLGGIRHRSASEFAQSQRRDGDSWRDSFRRGAIARGRRPQRSPCFYRWRAPRDRDGDTQIAFDPARSGWRRAPGIARRREARRRSATPALIRAGRTIDRRRRAPAGSFPTNGASSVGYVGRRDQASRTSPPARHVHDRYEASQVISATRRYSRPIVRHTRTRSQYPPLAPAQEHLLETACSAFLLAHPL